MYTYIDFFIVEFHKLWKIVKPRIIEQQSARKRYNKFIFKRKTVNNFMK